MIVHLNGWPGVGKYTIGQQLTQSLNARFIHNHVLHDVALVCAGYESVDRWALYEKVRSAAYDVLSRKPSNELFVMTNALCKTDEREVDAWAHVVKLAMSRGVPLVPIVLNAPAQEIASRMRDTNRSKTKLSDVSSLYAMMETHQLQVPAIDETLLLDVSNKQADEAAAEIVNYLAEHSVKWSAASSKHFTFR